MEQSLFFPVKSYIFKTTSSLILVITYTGYTSITRLYQVIRVIGAGLYQVIPNYSGVDMGRI